MKYKVGQTVWNKDFGKGVVKFVPNDMSYMPYAVEFIKPHGDLHSCSASGGPHCAHRHGYWCFAHEIYIKKKTKSKAELQAKFDELKALNGQALKMWHDLIAKMEAWDE